MAFRTTPAPYLRAKKSTTQIMCILGIALLIVFVAAVVTNSILSGVKTGLKAVLMLVVSLATTAVCDVVTSLLRFKKDGKEKLKDKIIHDLIYNYSWITSIIFTLTLPVWTSYYVVIIGSIFATVICKNVFGGFGKNIFNPAVMARIFVGVCFTSVITASHGANSAGFVTSYSNLDAISSATVTTVMKNSYGWLTDSAYLGNITISDLLFGNYIGALGETCTVLIFVLGIALSVLEVINWRTPTFYLGTVVLSSLVIGLATGMDNPLTYVLYSISLGGVMFGAVFMITDPVTGPTSNLGKSIIGVVAGLLTTLVRLKTSNVEGVALSIAFCNLISPAIDYFCTSKSNAKLPIKYAVVFGLVAIAIGLNTGIAISQKDTVPTCVNGVSTTEITTITDSGFVLKEGHSLKANDGTGVAYYVVDNDNNVVAEIYYASATNTIVMGKVEEEHEFKVLVGVNVADGSIYDIGYITDPAINADYVSYVKSIADKITNVNAFNANAFAGASYSKVAFTSIFEDVAEAFYNNHPELNNGGNK